MASTSDLVYDPQTNSWHAPQPPATPALQRRGQRERAARAVHAAQSSAHKDLARGIAQHLDHIEGAITGGVEPFVRANTGPRSTFDQRQNAANAINANLSVAKDEAQAARDKLAQLRTQALASIAPQLGAASEQAMLDRKADLTALLEQAGQRGAQAQAERLVKDAVSASDTLTLAVLLGDPMRLRAASLGIDQTRLQALYAQLQLAAEGSHPLGGSAIASDELVRILSDQVLEQAIQQHEGDANAFLMGLGRDTGLIR